MIQNIRRRRMALSEVSRVLGEGGRAALSFPRKTKVSTRGLAALGLTRTRRLPCGEDLAVCLKKRHA